MWMNIYISSIEFNIFLGFCRITGWGATALMKTQLRTRKSAHRIKTVHCILELKP